MKVDLFKNKSKAKTEQTALASLACSWLSSPLSDLATSVTGPTHERATLTYNQRAMVAFKQLVPPPCGACIRRKSTFRSARSVSLPALIADNQHLSSAHSITRSVEYYRK